MTEVLATLSRTFYEVYPVFSLDDRCVDCNIDLVLTDDQPLEKDVVKEKIRNKEVYVVTTETIDKEVLDCAVNLRLIVKYGVGVDNIDLEYAAGKGIPVTNAPGQNALSVADLTMGLLLSAARQIPQAYSLVKSGNWRLLIGNELGGKVLGIIGLGSIGKEVAKRARGFGLQLIAYDPYQDKKTASELGVRYEELNQLLQESDFICLNLALSPATHHLINEKTLSLMKKTAYIINTSRGPVIDENALIGAVREQRIAGAALDVFESEPVSRELLDLVNVITTPHIGGSTHEASRRIGEITINNIMNCLQGKDLQFVVNAIGTGRRPEVR